MILKASALAFAPDGVSGLEEGAKAIFKNVVVQRCIVHLIRNSIKYVPTKDYKEFTQSLKKVYGAPSLSAARKSFEQFCQEWSQYPGAFDVWKRNYNHVEQLFDYDSAVRKVMYTTNAVESINFSFRKVTKKGAFRMKMLCSNYCILELPNYIKNGIIAKFKIGLWLGISSLMMKKLRLVLKNMII